MTRAANPSHALATVFVDELVRCGLRHVCIAPGSRSAALAMAFAENDGVRTHVGVDERSVSFLALGMARATGTPVAVVTTSGTATANLHPAVVEADLARVPLVVLTADRPPELRQTGANQTIDQLGLYGRAVRFFADVGVAEDRAGVVAYWRSLVCRAWAGAVGAGNPPGPVHLNVPFREPLVPVEVDARGTTEGPFTQRLDGRADGRPWTEVAVGRARLDGASLESLADRIAGTERGLIVAGASAATPDGIVALAEVAGWPIVAEPLSGARRGRNALVAADALAGHPPFAEDHRPDLVIRLGRIGLSRPVLAMLAADVPQVLIDRDAAWLDPERSVAELLAVDADDALTRLTAALSPRPDSDWLTSWRSADETARDAITEVLEGISEPTEPRTARDVAAAVPPGGALVVGSSMPVRDLDRFMLPHTDVAVVGNRGASGIDGFVSTALGVAVAREGPTLGLCGDLSVLHDTNGMASVVEGEADLVVVVVNNDGGGIFSLLPQAAFTGTFEQLFGTPHGTDVAALVGAHGWGHRYVDRADHLTAAIEDAMGRDVPQVVEVRTQRDANATLHRQLRDAVRTALDAGWG